MQEFGLVTYLFIPYSSLVDYILPYSSNRYLVWSMDKHEWTRLDTLFSTKEMTSSSLIFLPAFLTMHAVGISPASSSGYLSTFSTTFHTKEIRKKVTIHIELQTYIYILYSSLLYYQDQQWYYAFYISIQQLIEKLLNFGVEHTYSRCKWVLQIKL